MIFDMLVLFAYVGVCMRFFKLKKQVIFKDFQGLKC